jgi:hypothetical protein
MADLQGKTNPQRKEQVNTADLAFLAFVVIITAIAVLLTLAQIYLIAAAGNGTAPEPDRC